MESRGDYTAIVVSETHWDRAWYATFEQFRYRLVQTMDRLIEILDRVEEFHSFTLDGQTVLIEDYLAVRPEQRSTLARLVQGGKLLVGPWYVLPDEFLVSGEALVRNLLIGHRVAGELGRVMKVGYLPDPFGHVSQMPRILGGFGIDSFIFTRGLGDEASELGTDFRWLAPDGQSDVLAVHQIGGYGNLSGWGLGNWADCHRILTDPWRGEPEVALNQVKSLIRLFEQTGPTTRYLLFNNGADHLGPQAAVPAFIRYVNEQQTECRLVHGTFADYVQAVRDEHPALATFQGELHRGKFHPLLSGVFSSRIYLKQANHHAQVLLEKYVEPLAALAWYRGADYPEAFLSHAWRTLLKNHPHDDICGCSVDAVHEDMEGRFRHVQEAGGQLLLDSAAWLASDMNTDQLPGAPMAVYNPLCQGRVGVVEGLVYADGQWSDGARLAILDHRGQRVPGYGLVSCGRAQEFGRPLPGTGRPVAVSFLARDLPPCGLATYYLVPEDGVPAAQAGSARVLGGTSIANEFFLVEAEEDGTLTVTDHQSGATYAGLHYLEDTEDAGDEYDYSPVRRSSTVRTGENPTRVVPGQDELGRAWLDLSGSLRIPAALTPDRTERSGHLLDLPARMRVCLTPGIRRIDCHTVVDNQACDHRLRVVFPTGVRADQVLAESKFDVVRRPLDQPPGTDWVQPPVPTQHEETFVSVAAGGRGLAVLNRGLPEYEARSTPAGVELCLTLFRSVGWLSRDDLLTRKGHAGPGYATPGAQCLGIRSFDYAILPHGGDDAAALSLAALAFVAAPMVVGAVRSQGSLGPVAPLVKLDGDGLVLSAIKKAGQAEWLVVRFYNPTDRTAEGFLQIEGGCGLALLLNLGEEEQGELPREADGRLRIVLRPKGIMTVGLARPIR